MATCKHPHIVALLAKSGELIGTIALDIGKQSIAVGSSDNSIDRPKTLRAHETAESAVKEFKEAIAVSRQRGWHVIYHGQRNHG